MSFCIPREEANDVKDSAEKVKQALEEARRAQTVASSVILQAAADIRNTNDLLSDVSTVCHQPNVKIMLLIIVLAER